MPPLQVAKCQGTAGIALASARVRLARTCTLLPPAPGVQLVAPGGQVAAVTLVVTLVLMDCCGMI